MDRQLAGLDDESLGFVLQTLSTVAERRLGKDVRLALDENDTFPTELIAEMLSPEVGLHLIFLPEEVGGLGGGGRDLFRVSEELARIDLGVATAFLAIALGVDPIIVGGTDEQKQRWLGRIAEEGLIVAYGVTEPMAGSNVANVSTTAEPVLDDAGELVAYRLNGVKQFITNGSVAQIYTILARTPGGPSFFVVDRETEGLSAGLPEVKHGIRASNTTQVVMEDMEVPADQLLGLVEGQGLQQANKVFGFTRLMVAAFGLGAGEEALARAVTYSQERQQFNEPLWHKQGFTHKLIVPHVVRLEAARAYCEAVARRLDLGEDGLQVEGAVAKLFASEVGNEAADAAIQAHGGYGYIHEYEVEKIRRDVRITSIYEGTSEILQSVIGIHRWRQTVKTKGGFYRDMATALRSAGAGEAAAQTADAMAETFLACHAKKLPREQWVMFELARLAAEVETATALALKAAKGECDNLELVAVCADLHARRTARDVAVTGVDLLRASDRYSEEEIDAYRAAIDHDALMKSADGELATMNRVVEIVYG